MTFTNDDLGEQWGILHNLLDLVEINTQNATPKLVTARSTEQDFYAVNEALDRLREIELIAPAIRDKRILVNDIINYLQVNGD